MISSEFPVARPLSAPQVLGPKSVMVSSGSGISATQSLFISRTLFQRSWARKTQRLSSVGICPVVDGSYVDVCDIEGTIRLRGEDRSLPADEDRFIPGAGCDSGHRLLVLRSETSDGALPRTIYYSLAMIPPQQIEIR